MKKLRIGVLGTANIALRSVIPSMIELEHLFEFIGIASRNMEKAQIVADKFGVKAFGNYLDILDNKYIDAVYIPLPNSYHFEFVKKSLDAGLHVLVEKSMACTYNEVFELNELAAQNKLALIENFQFRFHKQLGVLFDLIRNGAIGEIRSIKAYFGFPPFKDKDNIRYQASLGGGALLDAGAYPVKVTQLLLGNNLIVQAANLYTNDQREVDIYGNALLKEPSTGISAFCAFGFDNFYQCGVEVWGSSGKVSTNRLFTAPFGFKPTILLENNEGNKVIEVESDNHFNNMLCHFYSAVFDDKIKHLEYTQNVSQARIISEIKTKSYE